MTRTRIASSILWALVCLLAVPPHARGQAVTGPEIWRAFAEKVEPGRMLKVRLRSGQRFRATLLQVSTDAITVQPKTRAAVPPQRIVFDQIETLEIEHSKGVGIGKAVAIGASVAAGAWLALMALAFAVWGD